MIESFFGSKWLMSIYLNNIKWGKSGLRFIGLEDFKIHMSHIIAPLMSKRFRSPTIPP